MITEYRHKYIDQENDAVSEDALLALERLTGSPIPNTLRDFLRSFHGSAINYAVRIETDDEPWTVPMHTILGVGPDERESPHQPTSITGFIQYNAQMDDVPTTYIPFGFFLPGILLLCDSADSSCPVVMLGDDLETDEDEDIVTVFPSFNDYVDAWFIDDESICAQIRLATENPMDTDRAVPYFEWLDVAVPNWRSRYADACPGIANAQ
jgi:hypothetical protein